MEILGAIIVGLIVGALAGLIVPGRTPLGCLGTVLVGIGGGILGNFVFEALFDAETEELNWIGSFLIAVVGAVLILFLLRAVSK
jgi:uncharacterized membrane protein YeaQ/YmgE (transglycosylase-associated protein family)